MKKITRYCTLAGASLLLAATAACSSGASVTEVDAGAAQAAFEANQPLVEAAFTGGYSAPPATGPAAVKGKKVWIISCGESITSCNVPSAAIKEAGEKMGWDMTIFDGKLDPANSATGIREAMAARADGIIGIATDCDKVGAPLREAKAAGIATIGFSSFDCTDPAIGAGESAFSTSVLFQGFDTMSEYRAQWGAEKAKWAVNATDGAARVLLIDVPGSGLHETAVEGFRQQLDECDTCEVTGTVEITSADTRGPVAGQKLEAALLKYPNANMLVAPNDAAFGTYVNSALNAIGRPDMQVVGGECFEENLDHIRGNGPQNACVALPQEWQAWAVVDQLNRYFVDPSVAPVDQGLGFQLVDKEHNMPESGAWTPSVDYKAGYLAVWGK